MKALIGRCTEVKDDMRVLSFDVAFFDDNSTPIEVAGIDAGYDETMTGPEIRASVVSAVLVYAGLQSYSLSAEDVLGPLSALVPAGLSEAPGAAIADAPADAVTDYNTITTLLGALTGAVNTANGKQNEIATKLNALLAELRTLGLIAA